MKKTGGIVLSALLLVVGVLRIWVSLHPHHTSQPTRQERAVTDEILQSYEVSKRIEESCAPIQKRLSAPLPTSERGSAPFLQSRSDDLQALDTSLSLFTIGFSEIPPTGALPLRAVLPPLKRTGKSTAALAAAAKRKSHADFVRLKKQTLTDQAALDKAAENAGFETCLRFPVR